MFEPDYRNLVLSAYNVEVPRTPLYEHIISTDLMERVTGTRFSELMNGDRQDLAEFFRRYCLFFRDMGYDAVSFEVCVTSIFPGGGALGRHVKGAIQNRADFDRYPWDGLLDAYFHYADRQFEALGRALPPGMKAVGGVGNGVFECVQDLVGYMDLCYLREDDPELYADLYRKVGDVSLSIWRKFLDQYGDFFCVCRFGDDLGFKSTTLLPPDDIRAHIIPQYLRITDAVHAAGKPFLLHSCGNIFNVMDDMISLAHIDAKHSNEDQIAPFPVWAERYGDKIGNFGGIDTDAVCRLSEPEMRAYIRDVVARMKGHGGFAFGSGNSIPDYVPTEGFLNMNRIIRELRGE